MARRLRRAGMMLNDGEALVARPFDLELDSDDFIEAFHDMRKFFWRGATESCTNALDSKDANLADLDPRALGQLWRLEFVRERETCALRLAGQRYRDNSAGALVEHVVA